MYNSKNTVTKNGCNVWSRSTHTNKKGDWIKIESRKDHKSPMTVRNMKKTKEREREKKR